MSTENGSSAARVEPVVLRPLRAMVLVFEPLLTHSVWQDYGGMCDEDTGDEIIRSDAEMVEDLKQGVRDGRYVGWRLHRVEREVLGNVD